MNRIILFSLIIFFFSCSKNKKEFLIINETSYNNKLQYFILNQNNDTIKKYEKGKYFHIWGDTINKVLIVAPSEKSGWWAIDLNENYLFEVYNTSYGEVSPDEYNNGMIRITDESKKIGYANESGKIIIEPKFEFASEFINNYAIIGRKCKEIPWEHNNESVCHHISIECDEYGYIDKKGNIIEIGNYKFEDLAKKLKWPNY